MTDRPDQADTDVLVTDEQTSDPPVDAVPVTPQDSPVDPAVADPPADELTDDDQADVDDIETSAELGRLTAERDTAQADLATAQARIAALEAQIAATQPDPTAEAQSRAEAAELRASRLEAAADAGVPIALLRSLDQLHAATTSAQFTRAFSSIQQTLAASAQPAAGNPSPPSHPTEPPTLEQRIADAERSGDFTTAIRLKNERLRQL